MSNTFEYLVGAAAYIFVFEDEKDSNFPTSASGLADRFEEFYGRKLSIEYSERIIIQMGDLGLIRVINEEYAGLIIRFDQEDFDQAFKRLAEQGFGKFFDLDRAAGDIYHRTMENEKFWADLTVEMQEGNDSSQQKFVPASNRIVTISHNSEEGVLILGSLDQIVDDLEKNNEIAAQAGQDRERLIAEAKASREIILGVDISERNLRSLVWDFFKEIAKKFKSRASEWSVAQVISLLERLLDLIK